MQKKTKFVCFGLYPKYSETQVMNFLHILRKFGFIFFAFSLTIHSGYGSLNSHFQEFGQAYIRIYLPGPYIYAHQYNSIVQDHEGFLYIGSDKGALRFDGTHWKFVPADGKVSLTSSGTLIFAASNNEISCLKRGSDGSPIYNTLPGTDEISGNIGNSKL